MTPAERRLPENDDGQANWDRWMEHFEREREAVIATNDGPRSRETRYNTYGRKDWWGATGHTVASAIEAAPLPPPASGAVRPSTAPLTTAWWRRHHLQ